MAENKTKANDASVQAFLDGVEDARKREDSLALVQLMQDVTGEPARMWGDSIIGFGSCHYQYDSGREGDMPLVGFSPRKQNLALYILSGSEQQDLLLNRLGKHKTGKSCLYLRTLKDVDLDVLREMVVRTVQYTRENYPESTGE